MLVEADICPLCLDVFQGPKELLNHVFQTHHVSLQPPCQICLEHCQHQNEAVIKKDTNENVRIKTEPVDFNESQNEQQSEICDTKENVKIEPKEINGNIEDTETLSNSDIVQCDICDKHFDTKELFEDHQCECQEIHQCDLCPMFFNSKAGLQKHNRDGHNCEFCPTIFKSVEGRSHHISQNHNFQCHNCHLIFPLKQDLKYHECLSSVTPTIKPNVTIKKPRKRRPRKYVTDQMENWFPCTICNLQFSTKLGRNQHKRDKHQEVLCDKCEQHFPSAVKLQEHKKSQHPNNKYLAALKSRFQLKPICEFCDEKFTSEINLKHHVEIVHSKGKDVGQNSKKRKPENDGKGPDDKSTKKVKFNV